MPSCCAHLLAGVRNIACEKKLKDIRKGYLVQLVFERADLTAPTYLALYLGLGR